MPSCVLCAVCWLLAAGFVVRFRRPCWPGAGEQWRHFSAAALVASPLGVMMTWFRMDG